VTVTNQEIFDKVAKHLLAQGAQALSPQTGACKYRAGGLACAVGCLIPDEEYSLALEGLTVKELVGKGLLPPSLGGVDIGLLTKLQQVHDSCRPSDWPERLRDLALDLGLVPPEVTP
jgi:hypothetical protein